MASASAEGRRDRRAAPREEIELKMNNNEDHADRRAMIPVPAGHRGAQFPLVQPNASAPVQQNALALIRDQNQQPQDNGQEDEKEE
jgi:hypothetical protein